MNLKVATYNIEFGLHLKDIAGSIETLAAKGVSLFCLQEVCEYDNRAPILQTILKNLGAGWEYKSFIRPNTHDLGLALLWKPQVLKLIGVKRLLLPKLEKFNFYENLVEKKLIKVVNVPVQRGALIGTFKVGGKSLQVMNLHLDWHGGFRHRAEQFMYAVSHLKKKTDYQVVCGDLNTVGIGILTRKQEIKILSMLEPGFVNAYPRLVPTQRKSPQRLDYIFAKGSKIREGKLFKLAGSDHFPLTATLEL